MACEYCLRRVGKASTLEGVKDFMKLGRDVTRFGRHSGNDFYLDSAELDFFISRWHSEIHRVEQNNVIRYVVRDNSLNGTYVNDARIKSNHVLEEGDVITFGHTNGKNIRPGQMAPQDDSEFSFTFGKLRKTSEVVPSSQPTEIAVQPVTSLVTVPSSPGLPVLSTSVGDVPTSSQKTPGMPLQCDASKGAAVVSRRILHSPKSSTMVLKDISNSTNRGGLLNLADLATAKGAVTCEQIKSPLGIGARHSTSDSDEAAVFRQAVLSAQHFGESQESEEDIFSNEHKPHGDGRVGFTTLIPFPGNRATMPSSLATELTSSPPTLRLSSALAAVYASAPCPITAHLEPQSKSLTAKHRQRKSTERATASLKRHKGPLKSAASQKRRRRSSTKSSAPNTDSEMDEDLTHSYAGDQCDAYDCCHPTGIKVSWVQCDDCDKWYHTACAGCNYDTVKEDTAQFHCGC